MYNPVATYRIQFHKDFSFKDFEGIIPYLQKLGIGTVYASPLFAATPGSTHGYDAVGPHRINSEIGTEEQLKSINKRLKGLGIGWLQDIVPNHLAFHPNNPWLMDVLEKGPQSRYAHFFDCPWSSNLFHGRLMVPFLGNPLEEVLEKCALKVGYQDKRFVLKYYDQVYPLQLHTYKTILNAAEGDKPEDITTLLTQIHNVRRFEEAEAFALRMDELQLELASLMKEDAFKVHITKCMGIINEDIALLHSIIDEQFYRLCFWQETDQRINFRRFFTVNGLICLNIQDKTVFTWYHKLIKSLIDDGVFEGLRIDHIDGLYNPTAYLEQLRALVGEEVFIVVEKILEPGEELPSSWPIQGETGYSFLATINNLFTYKESNEPFTRFYAELVGQNVAVQEQIYEKKAFILQEHMQGELDNLCQLFMESALVDEKTEKEIKPENLKQAIWEFLIQCPVYRYYGQKLPFAREEEAAIREVFSRIKESKPTLVQAVENLEEVLLQKPHEGDEAFNERALKFYQRLMQFTGPLMAKGVEDTLMYTYNRFIGHNEVGDSPEAFGLSIEHFHQKMVERQERWPLALNTTATHDTKRGEDARMRLNVLTDLAEEWLEKVKEWRKLNTDLKQENAPDDNDEYFIYQTLLGTFPMPGQDEDHFEDRLQKYLEKALREAKNHSNWTTPNETYEKAVIDFAVNLLDKDKPFWKDFQAFHHKVAEFGVVNTLAQVLLKFTCPGVPDLYQGTELWDLSFVDPDNRRAVDYPLRQQGLEALTENDLHEPAALWKAQWEDKYNPRIKLWLTYTLLNERKRHKTLFLEGEYIPLTIIGEYKDHVLAFVRKYQQTWIMVAVPLHLAQLCKTQDKAITNLDWKDTRVVLPEEAPQKWQHLMLKTFGRSETEIPLQSLFADLPIAVLKLQEKHERSGGILLHITSLPSPFGIGDLGPEARKFADFLYRCHQKYWQLLPLNPIEKVQGYSPYSSTSSNAGNPLLISPELLAKEGFLNPEELQEYFLPQEGTTNYTEAARVKEQLFLKAWENFKKEGFEILKHQFQEFCLEETGWLDDFALYVVLKSDHEGKPWFEWPKSYKFREEQALNLSRQQNADKIEQIKWLQFIFFRQWKSLRAYCKAKDIEFFGDLPFYISYDSVDVWVNKNLFKLDEEGNMAGIAGVPPDYFNENGQLWGMPIFKWSTLKEQNYTWWIQRLEANRKLFDLIRLDHFRAFASYWEVPANEETAKNGVWKTGPGADFFEVVQKKLGELPFVAEDLGEIDDSVLALRDKFNLPGMKILQFAFGKEMPKSPYIPHHYTQNFIAYTGTHDNNTILGWYRQEGHKYHKQLEQYFGKSLSEDNIAYSLCHSVLASVAKTAILPLQDVLGLDEIARMNMPGSSENNWQWRLLPGQIEAKAEGQLKEWSWLFDRAG